jgi:hypothetical protein
MEEKRREENYTPLLFHPRTITIHDLIVTVDNLNEEIILYFVSSR